VITWSSQHRVAKVTMVGPYEGLLLAEADTWFQHLSSTLQLLALGKKDPPFVSGEE